MNLNDAEELACKLMYEHLGPGWSFAWANGRRVLGRCTYGICTISLSRYRTRTRTPAQVEDTIRHEIAHGLAGPEAGHGPVWQRYARAVGANPSRVNHEADGEAPVEAVYKWVATCSTCGKKAGLHRKSKYTDGGAACSNCCRKYAGGKFDRRFLLTFIQQW